MSLSLAFSTLPFPDLDAADLAALCRRHHMAAEVRCRPDGSCPVSPDLPVCSAGSSVCVLGTEDDATVERWCGQFRSLFRQGIRGVRVFLGNFRKKYSDPARPLSPDGICRILRKFCETGPDILIETHNEYATSDALVPLLREVGHPRLGVIWDCLHPLEDGEDVSRTWEALCADIRHIHIKDARPSDDPDSHDWLYTRLGEGTVPLGELLRMTRRDGYTGCYSLEWESPWRPELAGLYDTPDALLEAYAAFMASL